MAGAIPEAISRSPSATRRPPHRMNRCALRARIHATRGRPNPFSMAPHARPARRTPSLPAGQVRGRTPTRRSGLSAAIHGSESAVISLQRTHGRGERRRGRAGRVAAAHLPADAAPPGRASSRAPGRQGPPSQPLPRARRRDGRRFPRAVGAPRIDECMQSRAHIALCTSMCSLEHTDFCMPRVY